MIDLSKYSEKEVWAAIKVVEEIIDCEEFGLLVDEDEGELCFALKDGQRANLGDIESDRLSSLGGVIDRMEIYHNDYFYEAYHNRVLFGEEIPQDDWDRKILIFLENDYCVDLLMNIDVETYQKYMDKELSEIGLNDVENQKYVKDGKFDNVGYVVDKAIALDIMDTQAAYDVIEHNGTIYELYNPDVPGIAIFDFQEALEAGDVSDFDFCSYETYADLIEGQKGLIKDDFGDIGLYDEEGQWNFYLSEYELEYIRLGDEIERDMKLDISGLNYEELKDAVDLIDKLSNMFESEISEEVYEYVYNNQDVFDAVEAEVIKLLPEAIDKYGITTDDDVENCLYNCDAVYMEAICNVLGDKVIPVKCGYGMIEMKEKSLDSLLNEATVKSEASCKESGDKVCDDFEKE